MTEIDKGLEEKGSLKKIVDMIQDIKYGSVTVIIQDGKVIQVDKIEKHRIR